MGKPGCLTSERPQIPCPKRQQDAGCDELSRLQLANHIHTLLVSGESCLFQIPPGWRPVAPDSQVLRVLFLSQVDPSRYPRQTADLSWDMQASAATGWPMERVAKNRNSHSSLSFSLTCHVW